MSWIATREELAEDFRFMEEAHHALDPVECNHRIAYQPAPDAPVAVITPAPRFIAALMHGGYIRRVRVIGQCAQTGAPEMEGSGERMGPMTYDEAVAFVAWKDIPRGCNNFTIMTTDDLPRIRGDIDLARKFRNAWRLEQNDE